MELETIINTILNVITLIFVFLRRKIKIVDTKKTAAPKEDSFQKQMQSIIDELKER